MKKIWMDPDKARLPRRFMLASLIGAGFTGLARPARAGLAQYPQLVYAALPVRNLSGVSLVAGVKAGSRLLAGGVEGVIIYSDDAGQSWHQAAVPVSVTITCIAFASPLVGWATGGFGVVLKTEDGGKSWTKQLDGIAEIALMTAATDALAASPGNDPVQVERDQRRVGILGTEGPDKPFLSLLAISNTEVFAFGTYRFAEHSLDGGKNWADWSSHIGDPLSHNIYAAAAIGGAYYLVAEAGLIFRSTDGGQNFSQLAQLGNATFFGICDAGAGNLLAYGVAGNMYLSTDQGKSWNPPNFAGDANINAVVMLGQGLLAAGDNGGGIWLSRDSGASFSLMARNPVMAINALLPVGGMRFLILSGIGVYPADLSALHG